MATALVQRSEFGGDFLTGGYAAWLANDPAQLATQVQIISTRAVVGPVVDSLGLRLEVVDPSYRRFEVVDRAQVDALAPPGQYVLTYDGTQVVLTAAATGRTISAAPRGGRLAGPGFAFELAPGFAPALPVPIGIRSMEDAVARVQGGLEPFLDRQSNLIHIQYTSPDPWLATEAARAVARQYQYHAGGERRRKAAETVRFVNLQLADVDSQIQAAAGNLPGAPNQSLTTEYTITAEALRDARATAHEVRSRVSLISDALQAYRETSNLAVLTALGPLVPNMADLQERFEHQMVERSQALQRQGQQFTGVAAADTALRQLRGTIERQTEQTLNVQMQTLSGLEERISQLVGQQRQLVPDLADAAESDRRISALQQQWRDLVDARLSAQVEATVTSSPVEIVQEPVVPTAPLPENRMRTLIFALVAGLALGVIAALLLEQLDTRVRDPEDVQRSAGMGVIGLIPSLRYKEGGRPLPLSRVEDQNMGTEAFRKLRTNLRFVRAERPQLIAITSASPSEGKSVLSANLALALVQQRTRVLLIDADLRRPVQHSIFGLKRDPGLSDVLVGILPPTQAIRKDVEVPGLYVMPCGTEPPNPSELLGSPEFAKLLVQMRKHFDTVIVDTPPVHLVSDAAVVSTVVDGTLVVVDAGRTDRNVLAGAVNELRQARANLLGVVLNRVDSSGAYGYGYGHYGRYKRSSYYKSPAGEGEREWKETLDSFWKQVSPYV